MDGPMYVKALIAFVFVIGLLLLFAAALRLWGQRFGLIASVSATDGKKIQIVETAMMDNRHRMIRVRVENREHLILVGGATPVVVESKNIQG
jgi:flagellar protein FliO/FliZ